MNTPETNENPSASDLMAMHDSQSALLDSLSGFADRAIDARVTWAKSQNDDDRQKMLAEEEFLRTEAIRISAAWKQSNIEKGHASNG